MLKINMERAIGATGHRENVMNGLNTRDKEYLR